jgi:hypothetical protein
VKTLAVLVFIAGTAALAVFLARKPTIADGRVIEADLLANFKKNGVTKMACDSEIPIGKTGAVFRCVATLEDGATQTVEYTLHRAGDYTAKLLGATGATRARIPTSGDPWAN